MAKEWYLLKTPYQQVSGYENADWRDFAQDSFNEALYTSMGETVELCNYDLSYRQIIRAVVQGSVQDTKLNSLSRQILVPIGTLVAGMYIKYKNRYWLIVGLADDNTMYEKAVMAICNYKVSWLNDKKEIITRYVNVASASQYNNGETGSMYFYTRSDQLLMLLPDDDESLLLTNGKRFIIDRRCEIYEKGFSEDVVSDTSNPVVTYKITRADSVLYNYHDSGHQEVMLTEDEQQPDDGYYVVDGAGYWLCGEPDATGDLSMSGHIIYDSLELYDSLEPDRFTAVFYDGDGNEVEVEPTWEIDCPFVDRLFTKYDGNSIYIWVNDGKLVNKSFDLSLSADGYKSETITVYIRAFI